MSDYISREAAIHAANRADDRGLSLEDANKMSAAVVAEIKNIQAADVAPVRRGKWIKSKKHIWEKNKDGTVNEFAWDRGIHNGPFCTICGETPCVHCEPDYDEKDCEKEHYICPFCERIEMDFQPFCNCGAKMEE